ncbi:DUF1259 domain-containing protein [Clostridium felsineum]|uniref:Uncharacterized protein n=1 Tax=Clostridium felsineum TaxID=36839 RepID=A0A1S8LQG5_9CLOT|nr:DUF1259 domain-containing protein [Clostridium felsineum]URZ07570.1 hypothetical protein CLROS_029090 [Clostridium felsineum]URZ12601.1 hypothetical protein CROST_033240 [Clostridium felsineum]
MPDNLCRQFAQILNSNIMDSKDGSCSVIRLRDNLKINILGRPSTSGLTLAAMFSYEDMDQQGNTLNLGETVILPREIYRFSSILQRQGIIVTAVHNHWLFDNPRIMYIHFESVEPPLHFAMKVAKAFQTLT